MTELLDRMVARIRDLPDDDQDALASVLMTALIPADPVTLDEQTRRAIRTGLAQADDGDYATDEDIASLWRRHGL